MAVTTQLSLRIEESEKKFLEELCNKAEISQAQAIRDYINASWNAGGLIISPMGDDRQSSPLPPDIGDRLTNLEKQLTHVTEQVEARFALCAKDGDRLDSVTEHLRELALRQIEIERAIAKLPPDLERRLGAIDALIEIVANFDPAPNPETAIMIQKKPLELPPTPTEITLTHEEAAREFQRTAQTVKRWSSDPNKWPPGWIYDSDKNYWTKDS